MATKSTTPAEIVVSAPKFAQVEFCILGTTPLVMNRMPEKAWQELILPKGRKTASDKATNMKHDPLQEFRNAPYITNDDKAPALLYVLPTAIKKAMCTAALMESGINKTDVQRLVYVPDEGVQVFGIPEMFMAIVRMADPGRTPDVRTRAILPEWACKVQITFDSTYISEQTIANLLAGAGFRAGIGDWRQEKSGSKGAFKLVSPDDPDFVRIVETQGRSPQLAALRNPQPYNEETAELYSWFVDECKHRGVSDKITLEV